MIYFILICLIILSALMILILKLKFHKIMNDCLFGDFWESNHFARFKAGIHIIVNDVISEIKRGRSLYSEPTCGWKGVEKKSDNYGDPVVESQGIHVILPTDFVSSPPKEETGAIVDEVIRRRSSRRRANQERPAVRLPINLRAHN